ncbi:hypothetical protein pdam_00020828, partial [Pocillopora damicornis]
FLGTEDVMISDDDVMYAEALKKYTAQTRSVLAGDLETYCELCIGRTYVWIEEEKTGVRENIHRIREIPFITQDPDDKTVFGFVSSHHIYENIYELYAFKSQEAEVIIKTLRECIGPATNIMTEAAGSLNDGKNDKMTGSNFYALVVGSMVEVPC